MVTAVSMDTGSLVVYGTWHDVGEILSWPACVIRAHDEDQLLGKFPHHEPDGPPEIPDVSYGVFLVVNHVGASDVYTDVDGVCGQTENMRKIYLFTNARTCNVKFTVTVPCSQKIRAVSTDKFVTTALAK